MAHTLTLLGTNTVYVQCPQDYEIKRCSGPLPDPLQDNVFYVTEFTPTQFRYTVKNPTGTPATGCVYTQEAHAWSALARNLGKVATFGKVPEIYVPVATFDSENLDDIKHYIIDIAVQKGRAKPADYPRGETLGFIASRIQRRTPSGSTPTAPSTALIDVSKASSVAIVEGPELLGSNVGIKICEGLINLMGAVASGETVLNIIAHSRGAVEAILVAHELNSLQNVITETTTVDELIAILLKTPCPYTKAAFDAHFKTPAHRNFLEAILPGFKRNIKMARINICDVDPVPGDADNKPLLSWMMAWQDPRFFKLPPIVDECRLFIMQNEHSRFFKAIIPTVVDDKKTRLTLLTLPGHHGTASGNPYDQTKKQKKAQPNTWGVQNLMVCELVDFLTRHGETIKPLINTSSPLDDVLKEHLTTSNPEENLLFWYEEIRSHLDDYQAFNYTGYGHPALRNQTLSLLGWYYGVDREGNRLVHAGDHIDTPLSAHVGPNCPRFINAEHATLYLILKKAVEIC